MGTWSEQGIETLRAMWPKHSAAQIGELLGKTRNSVIGKARRLNLEHKFGFRVTSDKPKMVKIPKPKRAARPKVNGYRHVSMAPLVAAPKPEPVNGGLTILELRYDSCREVIGRGPDGHARYCGNTKQAGSGFCPYHHSINYTPNLKRAS